MIMASLLRLKKHSVVADARRLWWMAHRYLWWSSQLAKLCYCDRCHSWRNFPPHKGGISGL